MQSRQPRLGDILDDYCPRERRLTNHAVVAMIGDQIKQTRCTTCDAEHEYKHAKIPAQRKKKTGTGALYDEVLAGGPAKLAAPAVLPSGVGPPAVVRMEPDGIEPVADGPAPVALAPAAATVPEPTVAPGPAGGETDGPVHRQLIRATLPRVEGQVKERPIPEFTARTAATRPGRFRPHGGQGQGGGQGRPRGGHPQGGGGQQPDGNRFGRRGPGQFAAAGAPGNRAQAPQGDRQGHRRRGGRHRSK